VNSGPAALRTVGANSGEVAAANKNWRRLAVSFDILLSLVLLIDVGKRVVATN
jgi:hypothetical protein